MTSKSKKKSSGAERQETEWVPVEGQAEYADEVPTIDVNDAGASAFGLGDLLGQTTEVGRQQRWGQLHGTSPPWGRLTSSVIAVSGPTR